ncbi:hypothetical protein QL285_078568 [Trifolium repens]|nr:hypothetical protein QL285_078568 [Trifolium repens]
MMMNRSVVSENSIFQQSGPGALRIHKRPTQLKISSLVQLGKRPEAQTPFRERLANILPRNSHQLSLFYISTPYEISHILLHIFKQ